jgi:ribonuclease BN (tRNA processing enzyme)
MKIIFLGTNGWYDTKTGNTVSILIVTKEHNIVLDAGAVRLALVHFDAAKYTTMELRKKAEKEAQKIFPNTFACEDDQIVEM